MDWRKEGPLTLSMVRILEKLLVVLWYCTYTFCSVDVKLVFVTLESVAVRILCEYPVNGSPPEIGMLHACH